MTSYKTLCPSCGKESFYITPQNGMGYCFRPTCKYIEFNGTTTKKVIVRSDNVNEIREIYKKATKYYHSSLDTTTIKYLHNRGFTDKTIQDLQIGFCPQGIIPLYRDPVAKESGIATTKSEAFLGNRITFPYFKDDHTITDIRGRAIDPNEELRYKSPFGSAIFRGAIYPYNHHLHENKHIILTEAEIKANIAYQLGYAAMGIPGISSWRNGFSQDDKQRVTIVFDNESNPETQRDVIAAVRKVAGYLIKPFIAVLPLFAGERKAEVDTFINKYGGDLFRSVIDNALDYKTWNALQSF